MSMWFFTDPDPQVLFLKWFFVVSLVVTIAFSFIMFLVG